MFNGNISARPLCPTLGLIMKIYSVPGTLLLTILFDSACLLERS